MVGIVSSFEWEEVDVMEVVTLFANVHGNIASLIAAAQNVDADKRMLFFKFRYVFLRARKR